MSEKRRKYSSESSDDSYEKRKKSKYDHKEYRRKHKKEHKREEKRSSNHDRHKYRHDRDKEKYRSRHDDKGKERERDREADQKHKSNHKHDKDTEYDGSKKNTTTTMDTKKLNSLLPTPPNIHPVNTIMKEDLPSTSTNSEITLPSYYNSNVVNAQKFAEQQKKRKLLWQNKKNEESTKWTNLKFSQDNDGTKANKFMRLMGIKDAKEETTSQPSSKSANDTVHKSDEMLKTMEEQYEIARNITHLSRGVGLGFK